MPRNLVLGIVAAVVCIGGGIGFVVWQNAAARAEQVATIRTSVEIALAREPRNTADLQAELRQIDQALRDGDSVELRLLRGRIQLELGRLQDAWDTVADLALAPGGAPPAHELGARIMQAWHAQSGERQHAAQAFALAERHALETGSIESGFRAWQGAVRSDRSEDAARLRDWLQAQDPQHALSRLVALLDGFDPTENTSAAAQLDALARELTDVPPELTIARALLVYAAGEQDALPATIRELEGVALRTPALLNLRFALMLGYHLSGDRSRRDPHLRWLLDNAPEQDARRVTWEKLLRGG